MRLSETQKYLITWLDQHEKSRIEKWMKTQTIASLMAIGAIKNLRGGYIQNTNLGSALRSIQHNNYKDELKEISKRRKSYR